MFHLGQTVSVEFAGRIITGRIVRKQGNTGYYVRIPWTTTTQDFTTGKVTTREGSRDCYFKLSAIQAAA
jgi:ribosomal protein L35AE/L33A